MSVVSVGYHVVLYSKKPELFTAALSSAPAAARVLFESENNVAYLICIWHSMVNIADLLFGQFYYREHIDPMSGYFHHTLYFFMNLAATRGFGMGIGKFIYCNDLYCLAPYAPGITLGAIEEIPTFLLSLGSVLPSMRTDTGFGLGMILFRVIYHAWMFFTAIRAGSSTIVLVLFAFTLSMHTFWVKGWITSSVGQGVLRSLLGKKTKTNDDKIH